jgi:hypothetical protein
MDRTEAAKKWRFMTSGLSGFWSPPETDGNEVRPRRAKGLRRRQYFPAERLAMAVSGLGDQGAGDTMLTTGGAAPGTGRGSVSSRRGR